MVLFINATKKEMTFEYAVASFVPKDKNRREKGTVIAPPEIPEIEPIPERIAMLTIPITSRAVCQRDLIITFYRK